MEKKTGDKEKKIKTKAKAKAEETKVANKKIAEKIPSPKKKAPAKKTAKKEKVPLPLEPVRMETDAVVPPVAVKQKEKPPVKDKSPILAEGVKKAAQAEAKAVVDVKVKAAAQPKIEPKIEQKVEPKIEVQTPPKVEPVNPEQVVIADVAKEEKARILELEVPIALKDLASKIGVKPNELIIKLMSKNILANINQNLGEELVNDLLKGYGIEFKKPPKIEDQIIKEQREIEERQDIKHLVGRPPVVTFMGHVDHGKTSLMDFIRKTHVADKEKGGITQHIGAYEVAVKNGSVTFLDTPGHEAFTAMRARGANATDVVVLVVAADDGVMPQTKEALDHARAANVPIVVALNKCDLPSANLDKVKGQLSQIGLSPEDWGGKTITVPVSAKTGMGVEHLLEMLLLEAELLELKANPHLRARGIVIEGKLSSGQGPVATVLVKNGTLRVGDMVLSGMYYGRIKAMMNDKGKRIEEAGPSKPVSILGLSGVPMAGDEFFMVKDEKKAKTLSMLKQDEDRNRRLKISQRVTLEDFYKQMKEGVTKELAILLKGDVQGSVEAIQKSLMELNTKDVKVKVVHADVGNINDSDVMLAVVSNAVVMGFNVKIEESAVELASKEGIEIKNYGIIYEALQDVMAAMEGLLEPYLKEIFVGRATVKQPFKVSKVGTIAGCIVARGKIVRTGIAKLIRDKAVVYTGKIASLKRFKDDVRDVSEGVECGIALDRHDDIRAGDLIEVYQVEKVARRLDSRKD